MDPVGTPIAPPPSPMSGKRQNQRQQSASASKKIKSRHRHRPRAARRFLHSPKSFQGTPPNQVLTVTLPRHPSREPLPRNSFQGTLSKELRPRNSFQDILPGNPFQETLPRNPFQGSLPRDPSKEPFQATRATHRRGGGGGLRSRLGACQPLLELVRGGHQRLELRLHVALPQAHPGLPPELLDPRHHGLQPRHTERPHAQPETVREGNERRPAGPAGGGRSALRGNLMACLTTDSMGQDRSEIGPPGLGAGCSGGRAEGVGIVGPSVRRASKTRHVVRGRLFLPAHRGDRGQPTSWSYDTAEDSKF